MATIKQIWAREILDSRGIPTVETACQIDTGHVAISSVPGGTSTGTHEALELRDRENPRYKGLGVAVAVDNVNKVLGPALVGMDPTRQGEIDQKLISLGGTEKKEKLGANAILSVSQAAVKAAAYSQHLPLWKFINQAFFQNYPPQFPRIMFNFINGGRHAEWNFDIQEFMLTPKNNRPSEAIRAASEIFHRLGKDLKKRMASTLVGDEGGYSPLLLSNEDVLEMIIQSAQDCGYTNVNDYNLILDVAASEFYVDGMYVLIKNNKTMKTEELMEYYLGMQKRYSIYSFEDPFAADDWDNFSALTKTAANEFLVVGDDLYATNPKRIKKGIESKATNAILIKPNQIGTISETVEAIRMGRSAGWKIIISHRSGETEDSFIADFAYGAGADFLKSGSTCRSERLCKYNRLIEIENDL